MNRIMKQFLMLALAVSGAVLVAGCSQEKAASSSASASTAKVESKTDGTSLGVTKDAQGNEVPVSSDSKEGSKGTDANAARTMKAEDGTKREMTPEEAKKLEATRLDPGTDKVDGAATKGEASDRMMSPEREGEGKVTPVTPPKQAEAPKPVVTPEMQATRKNADTSATQSFFVGKWKFQWEAKDVAKWNKAMKGKPMPSFSLDLKADGTYTRTEVMTAKVTNTETGTWEVKNGIAILTSTSGPNKASSPRSGGKPMTLTKLKGKDVVMRNEKDRYVRI